MLFQCQKAFQQNAPANLIDQTHENMIALMAMIAEGCRLWVVG
jgi:hypothetical protein